MKELVGRTITAIHVNEDQSLLKFSTENEVDIIYVVEGDCCSETWWADIVFSSTRKTQFPFIVRSEATIEFPLWAEKLVNSDGNSRQEYDQVYGHKLMTNAGCVEFIYRNSSNGYYGGDYSLIDTGCSYNQSRLAKAMWTNITGDWNASNGMENV